MASTCSVFLNVRNVDNSLAFYRALGFTVPKTYKGDDGKIAYADLKYQGAEISIGDMSGNDDPDFKKWVSGELGAGVMVNFDVPNVDILHEKAKKAGATIEMPPHDAPYGRVMSLNDPDGYVIGFMKTARKTAKKAAKKSAKKGAKKSARKAPKAASKKVAKSAKKAVKKTAKKGAKKARKASA